MSYWEEYEHRQGFKRCLLLIRGKSRRSPSASASLGIRASALDFQKDVEERRRERREKHEKFVEKSCKQMMETLESILKEQNLLRAKEKERKEKEEKENEIKTEKERKEKEEQEKENKDNLISNELSSLIVELNLQELVEEIPKEASSNNFPILKKKITDIFPSAPLYVQPTFISPIHVTIEEKAKVCVVENTNTNQKLLVNDLFLCKMKFFHGFFKRKPFDFKQNLICSPFKEHKCFIRENHVLNIGVWSQGENVSPALKKRIKFNFQRIVFDPGG